MNNYYKEYDLHCPDCGASPLHYRHCIYGCDDGYLERFYDDAEIPGTGYEVKCPECKGAGFEWWCPVCGENVSERLNECGCAFGDD